jgi:hypothetical protein
MITVAGKALGQRRPLFEDWSIAFPPDLRGGGDDLTVRDLITRVVRAEVAAFRARQQERKLVRVLTARQIADGAAAGKVDAGGRDLDQVVHEEQAVAAALQAFEDGLYLLVLDGQELRALDRTVFLSPDSRLTFIRLTLLAGG